MLAVGGTAQAQRTVVRMTTDLGTFDVALLDTLTPITVENFLGYVSRGDYVQSFIHRSVPNFVVQGGGFGVASNAVFSIPTQPAIQNEPLISNVRGTVAMAKLGGNPDSATSQWFVSVSDNSANLDNQNGGFTVFATVLDGGMDTVDAINALPRAGNFVTGPTDPLASFRFQEAPFGPTYDGAGFPAARDLVYVTSAEVVANPAPIQIPDLDGLTRSDALQSAVLAGALLGDETGDAAVEPDECRVTAQSFEASSEAAPGTAIDVTFGRAVPALVNETAQDAVVLLESFGFAAGTSLPVDAVATERVIRQSVGADAVAPCGASIRLTLEGDAGRLVPILIAPLLED